MWVKVMSPNVESVEIVQRTEKRKRRARLYYMRYVQQKDPISINPAYWLTLYSRKPKHDMGSVENIVTNYLRRKSALMGESASRGRKGSR